MVAYPEIEEVSASPQFVNTGPPGWGFRLLSNPVYDEPYRPLLERLGEQYPECALDLPEHYAGEDCIEGTMTWQSNSIWVWYENLLSHLWLWSADRDAIQSLRTALLPLVLNVS